MSDIISFAQAGAVVMACWTIISGIGAWKREYIGKRQIELAEQVLAKFFEIRDAIAMMRSPFSYSGEGATRQKDKYEAQETSEILDRGYIVFERYAKKEAIFVEFNTLKYRFMASFGAEAEQIFVDTNSVLNSIFVSAQMLGTHYWQRQGRVPMGPEEFEAHLAEMQQHQRVFWDHGDENDEVRKELASIQGRLDSLVKPCFQEPMQTYSWLTKWRS
ncbi:MAG: hypothetical protein FDZ72_10605 [Betaproteobacteria bacterium]|nr:MAG: hypothetical protein FDZ72_10605 [Betaproteobacteria bacterium]